MLQQLLRRELAVVCVAEHAPPDRRRTQWGLAFAATTVREALAVPTVFLVAAVDQTRPHAAVQVAVAVPLRAFLAPIVQAPLAAAVCTAKATALRALDAAVEAAPCTTAVTFAESVRLRALVAAVHAARLALDPAAVFVQERAWLARERQLERRRWERNRHLRKRSSRHWRRYSAWREERLNVETAHDGVDEVLVAKDRAERARFVHRAVESRAVLERLELTVVHDAQLLCEQLRVALGGQRVRARGRERRQHTTIAAAAGGRDEPRPRVLSLNVVAVGHVRVRDHGRVDRRVGLAARVEHE